jgi:hypothetical protein
MGITVSGPGGVSIEFPDGTDEVTIRNVMSKAVGAQPAQPKTGTLEALGRGALQGATFGLSDEIYAGGMGAYKSITGQGTFSDTYNRELADVRAANTKAKQDAPIAYIGGEVAGGFALPAGVIGGAARAGKVAAEAGRLSRTAKGAAVGAGYGAAYGFGEGEGGDGTLLEQAGNRALNALPSALGGAVVGAAAPTVVDVGSAVVKGLTNPIRAAVNPVRTGTAKVAEALMRDAPPGMPIDQVVQRAGQRLEAAQAVKPDAMLADVGGQNTRDLLRAASNMPSQGAERLRKTLDRRQSFQWSRIERDVAETLSDGNQFARALGDLTENLKSVGQEEFSKAYAQPFNIGAGSDLARFITERGYVRRLLEKADESIQGMTGESPAKLSPWELLHRVKMEMDREIGRLKTGQQDAKANWTLRDLTQLKREMVDLMGRANPQFRVAMERYGDEAGLKTALERGADEFKGARAEEIRDALSKMTGPERAMYRMGAARSMFQDLERGNVTRDRTENLFSSPDIQKKLGALFPDQASRRDFQRRLVIEAKMADTRKAVQGNSTTAKQLAQGEEAGQPVAALNAVANMGAGRFAPAMAYLSRQVQAFSGMTPAVADRVIQSLMENSSTAGQRVSLMLQIERAAQEPAFRDQLVRRILAGSAAGRSSDSSLERAQQ